MSSPTSSIGGPGDPDDEPVDRSSRSAAQVPLFRLVSRLTGRSSPTVSSIGDSVLLGGRIASSARSCCDPRVLSSIHAQFISVPQGGPPESRLPRDERQGRGIKTTVSRPAQQYETLARVSTATVRPGRRDCKIENTGYERLYESSSNSRPRRGFTALTSTSRAPPRLTSRRRSALAQVAARRRSAGYPVCRHHDQGSCRLKGFPATCRSPAPSVVSRNRCGYRFRVPARLPGELERARSHDHRPTPLADATVGSRACAGRGYPARAASVPAWTAGTLAKGASTIRDTANDPALADSTACSPRSSARSSIVVRGCVTTAAAASSHRPAARGERHHGRAGEVSCAFDVEVGALTRPV